VDDERLVILIPAWNEEATIGDVLDEVALSAPDADVVVISDGSTDRTACVARRHGAVVLELPNNLGVGGAMRTGYLYAARNGYDRALQLDADGQHDPASIPALLAQMDRTGADLVIGARFAGTGSYVAHGPRRLAMSMLSGVFSHMCRTQLTDVTSGFKLSNRRTLEMFAVDYPAEYLGDTINALVMAARNGLVVRQVGVEMRPRAGGIPSHDPVRSAMFLLRAMVALTVALSRPHTEPAHREVTA
jgi:glycosyltransferase involved in cell wall biosynthesis